jgi:hypothetical protein
MPLPKRPFVASLDQVQISRQMETAVIEYADPDVGSVHLTIGPQIETMTDEEILDLHNDIIETTRERAEQYEHVAVEIPPGKPQLRFFEAGHQWVPRGDVLRCVIMDDEDGEAIVHIDDHELNMDEFGRMLRAYAGWGMRIVFVPDDRLHESPQIIVKEPDREKNE